MSFQVALSGLNAASTDLQITSNNIANANTNGFKTSRGEFADVYSGDAVGIGNGVRLSDVRQEFTQGNVEITSRQLDLAISGNGFFVTSDNGSLLYSRVGAFGLDANGIVQNAEGERLQVYPPVAGTAGFNTGALSDLQITTDTSPPVASTQVDMGINLPANATIPVVAPFDPNDPLTYNHSTSTILFDSLGVSHTASYFFSKTAPGWNVNMTFDGAAVGGERMPRAGRAARPQISENIRTTEAVNGLLGIAHKIERQARAFIEPVEDMELQGIGILEFIDQGRAVTLADFP